MFLVALGASLLGVFQFDVISLLHNHTCPRHFSFNKSISETSDNAMASIKPLLALSNVRPLNKSSRPLSEKRIR